MLAAFVPLLTGCVASPPVDPPVSRPVPAPNSATSGFEDFSSAAANRGAFDSLAEQVISEEPSPTTADFIHALRNAGLPDDRLEFSADLTTEGKPVDALFWAARFDSGCLIGQFRQLESDAEKTRYLSMEAPLVDGRCLLATQSGLGGSPG